jgi:hypothetical protein
MRHVSQGTRRRRIFGKIMQLAVFLTLRGLFLMLWWLVFDIRLRQGAETILSALHFPSCP